MWRCTLFWFAAGISLFASAEGWAQTLPVRDSAAALCRWARFEIVMGRMRVISAGSFKNESATIEDPASGTLESFAVKHGDSGLSVHYELSDAQQQLLVDFVDNDQVSIHREPRQRESSVVPLHFTQGERGELTLTIGEGASLRHLTGKTFWHLMLAEPALCRAQFVPLLEMLRPNWRLCELASEVELALAESAEQQPLPDVRRVDAMVARLKATSFQERQLADRELRQMGQAVLPYLDQLSGRRLDAEQRIRIRMIRQALTPDTGDTSLRVAAWLSSDRTVWLTMLAREEPELRLAAAHRLTEICRRPIEFDPRGDHMLRQTQLARLRSQLD